MRLFLKKNSFFFGCLAVFILAGGIYVWMYDKPHAVLFFSGNRTVWADVLFKFITRLGEEPLYILIGLIYLTKRVRHAVLIGITGFAVMGISYLLKWHFAIDRPLAYFRKIKLLDQLNLVEGVDTHSGTTSFPSGHAMSAFALFALLIFLMPAKKRIVLPLFLLASAVALSRVYLVQHFFVDIYTGALIGVVIAMVFYSADRMLKVQPGSFWEVPLFNKPPK